MKYLKEYIINHLIFAISVSTGMYIMKYTTYSIIRFNIFAIFHFLIWQILILYIQNFTNLLNSESQYITPYIQAIAIILAMFIVNQLL